MKFFKKIVFGILIAAVLFAIAYFFPNIYDVGFNPIDFYKIHTSYIIFLYISIILIYICATTHSRTNTAIMVTLLLINFLRLASFFTQDILGISTIEFYTLTMLFLLALAIMHIRYRIRYPLIVLTIIPCIIILLNHALPLYPNKPDFTGFYDTQTTTLDIQTQNDEKTLQEAETKITIRDDNTERTIQLSEGFAPVELGTTKTQIVFSSKTGIQQTYGYITFPKGVIIMLYPQSALTVEGTGINIIQGKINIYTPKNQSGYLALTGNLTDIIFNDTGNIQRSIDSFITKRNTYFIDQIGGKIMLNPTIDAFIGRYIDLANSASTIATNLGNYFSIDLGIPSFNQNKLNYDEFHTYLEYQEKTAYIAPTGSTKRIARDTQKGWDSTNSKARRNIIKNAINNILGK